MRNILVFGVLLLVVACVAAPQQSISANSAVTLDSARSIALITRGNSVFSEGLVTDILHANVDEAFRFTEIESFGSVRSRSIFRRDGTFTYTLLDGSQSWSQEGPNKFLGLSSGFSEIEIAEAQFQRIKATFLRLDICNVPSDFYDIDNLPQDGAMYSYEAIIDGKYCFAWFDSELKGTNAIPANTFDEMFEKYP